MMNLVLTCFAGNMCRIDENMDESLTNVEGAQTQLLKYLNSISSNRWLILKIFMVLITFLLIFVVFVA
jgi:syntaxin 5